MMPGWIGRYEIWSTTAGGRPTVAILSIVWIVLVLVHLPTIRTWRPSIQAFVGFALANVLLWNWFWWGRGVVVGTPRPPAVPETGWALHITAILIHLLVITSVWLVIALTRKYVFGSEDDNGGS